MKKWISLAVMVICCLGIGLGFRPDSSLAQEKTLVFYNFAEYIDPQIISDFEQETGAKVVSAFFESNEEMVAKLEGGGVSQYDVVVASDYVIPALIQKQLIQPLQKDQIPNIKNLSSKFVDPPFDPGNVYSVGYQWGTTGIGYRKDKVNEPLEPSWSLIFDASKQQGPFVLMDDQRPMIGIAARYLGFDMNTTNKEELQKVQELLLDAKKRSIGFIGGVGANNKLLEGTANVAVVWNTDVLRSKPEQPNLEYFVPQEGSNLWIDNMMIAAQAPHPELAHQFINYLLDAEVGALLSTYNSCGSPNEAAKAFIDPVDLNNPIIYPSAEDLEKLEYVKEISPDELRLIDALWTNVKSG
ncbi:MAG: spermidine/putrescine ABC transporter substrate-binding protein [Cyanobacteriota bacterium]|nr:spermidine/putrescine ABC transporter substrate-binding protein [Cyanobacteriota bacterium]